MRELLDYVLLANEQRHSAKVLANCKLQSGCHRRRPPRRDVARSCASVVVDRTSSRR